MAITPISTTDLNWSSDSDGLTVTITPPAGAVADDIVMVFLTYPNFFIDSNHIANTTSPVRPVIITSDFIGLTGGRGQILYRRVLATGEPTTYTITLAYNMFIGNQSSSGGLALSQIDQIAQAHAILLRNIDFYSVIEIFAQAGGGSNIPSDPKTGTITLSTTKE